MHRELIWLNRRQFVWQAAYYELLLVRNFDLRAHVVALEHRFRRRFRRHLRGSGPTTGTARHVPATSAVSRWGGAPLQAVDGVEYTTNISFTPAPTRIERDGAIFIVPLEPGEGCRLGLRVSCGPGRPVTGVSVTSIALYGLNSMPRRNAIGRVLRVDSSNPIFNELVRVAVRHRHAEH